jgi:hypothetical protein
LALYFSNTYQSMVEAGLPQALGTLLTSMLPELRLKALWAFKNLAYECEPQLQQQLLQELSWGTFRELLTADDDTRVRVQAVGLLQNLCKGGESIEQVRLALWGWGWGAYGRCCPTCEGHFNTCAREERALSRYGLPGGRGGGAAARLPQNLCQVRSRMSRASRLSGR